MKQLSELRLYFDCRGNQPKSIRVFWFLGFREFGTKPRWCDPLVDSLRPIAPVDRFEPNCREGWTDQCMLKKSLLLLWKDCFAMIWSFSLYIWLPRNESWKMCPFLRYIFRSGGRRIAIPFLRLGILRKFPSRDPFSWSSTTCKRGRDIQRSHIPTRFVLFLTQKHIAQQFPAWNYVCKEAFW